MQAWYSGPHAGRGAWLALVSAALIVALCTVGAPPGVTPPSIDAFAPAPRVAAAWVARSVAATPASPSTSSLSSSVVSTARTKDAQASSPPPRPLVTRVVHGDTLWGIARRYRVPLATLVAANPQVRDPRLIHAGDVVWIPREAQNATSSGRPTSGTLVVSRNTTLRADHHGYIVIRTDGVTLDCAGHLVSGPGRGARSGGIEIVDADHVTVRRCVVARFASNGLHAAGAADLRLEADTFVGNGNHGVHLEGTVSGVVTHSTCRLNGTATPAIGIVATSSTGVAITENVVAGHGWTGIALLDGTTASTVGRNTATGNYAGVTLAGESNDNVVRGNNVSRNTHGIGLLASRRNLVEANTANSNEYIGFSADQASSSNTFSGNTANRNNDGFNLRRVSKNLVTGNTATSNRHAGFLVWSGASDNTLSGNTGLHNAWFDAYDEGTGTGNSWHANTFGTASGP